MLSCISPGLLAVRSRDISRLLSSVGREGHPVTLRAPMSGPHSSWPSPWAAWRLVLAPCPPPEESLRPSTGAGRGFGGHSAVWNSGSRQSGCEAPCLPRTPRNSLQTVRPQALPTTGRVHTRSRARGPHVSGPPWCSGCGEPRGRSLQRVPHHWRLSHTA